ncbi:MAG: RecX family transcriptional regulator, partial [Prevotella sp.]|nr:RecX family transcriptional regulator [Prevotella sp.]
MKKMTEQEALAKLMTICSQAEHCSGEMVEKMRKWELEETAQARIMEQLVKGKFVDDERFTRAFAKDKLRYNKWGRRKIEPAFEYFRIEPHAAALEDFIRAAKPSAVLVGGTPNGRSLAPRVAARFRTGLTADCTSLGMSESTDLDQIRPAYGGNIMAHINTPRHRPQFATVRYKVFPIPPKVEPSGRVVRHALPPEKLASAIEILGSRAKSAEKGIEEAEVLVVCGRGVRRPEDIAMLRELADLLGGRLASTRAVV